MLSISVTMLCLQDPRTLNALCSNQNFDTSPTTNCVFFFGTAAFVLELLKSVCIANEVDISSFFTCTGPFFAMLVIFVYGPLYVNIIIQNKCVLNHHTYKWLMSENNNKIGCEVLTHIFLSIFIHEPFI